jgi:hypothetical protein
VTVSIKCRVRLRTKIIIIVTCVVVVLSDALPHITIH